MNDPSHRRFTAALAGLLMALVACSSDTAVDGNRDTTPSSGSGDSDPASDVDTTDQAEDSGDDTQDSALETDSADTNTTEDAVEDDSSGDQGEQDVSHADSDSDDPGVGDLVDEVVEDAEDAHSNQPPVATLYYEIELNEWHPVSSRGTVTRPLEKNINWDACTSSDPDGEVSEIWLHHAGAVGRGWQLMGEDMPCGEFDEPERAERDRALSYLLVIDDEGAETRLYFYYETE